MSFLPAYIMIGGYGTPAPVNVRPFHRDFGWNEDFGSFVSRRSDEFHPTVGPTTVEWTKRSVQRLDGQSDETIQLFHPTEI